MKEMVLYPFEIYLGLFWNLNQGPSDPDTSPPSQIVLKSDLKKSRICHIKANLTHSGPKPDISYLTRISVLRF